MIDPMRQWKNKMDYYIATPEGFFKRRNYEECHQYYNQNVVLYIIRVIWK